MGQQDTSSEHDIAVVISTLGPGGAERNIHDLVCAWCDQRLRIAVITFGHANSDFYTLPPEVDRYALDVMQNSRHPLGGLIANLRRIRALRRALHDAQAPRVLACVGATNVLTVIASRGLSIRTVIFETNDPTRQSLGRIWDLLRWLSYRFANRVTSNTNGALDALSSFVPQRKLILTPNPLRNRAKDASVSRKPWILSVGSLTHQKAHDVLLRAFAIVADELPSWELVILGDGPLRDELRDLSVHLEINTRVRWVGVTDDPFHYYERASLFTLPSRYEGLPNVMLEAMSFSLPVIVTDASPGPLEYVTDGRTGLVVPVDDPVTLAGAITRLVHEPTLRKELGQAARERVQGNSLQAVLAVWDEALGIPKVVQ